MKKYCFQFSTGIIFETEQDIVYNSAGYAIDKQSNDSTTPINGVLIYKTGAREDAEDVCFQDKDVVIAWNSNV